jgi:hypothetical protein
MTQASCLDNGRPATPLGEALTVARQGLRLAASPTTA